VSVRDLTRQLLLPESGREDNAITTLSPDSLDRGLAAPMHLCKGCHKAQAGTHCLPIPRLSTQTVGGETSEWESATLHYRRCKPPNHARGKVSG
jgi:hypothetical protein